MEESEKKVGDSECNQLSEASVLWSERLWVQGGQKVFNSVTG